MIEIRNPNGYGAVIKMSGKRRRPYAVRLTVGWSDDGKQLYKFLSYHAEKTDAMIALAEYNKAPYDIDANKITFAELYERYAANTNVSPSLERLNRTCFNHSETLHDLPFRDLRKVHFQSVVISRETPTAKANVAAFFRKLSKFALENDIIHKDYSQFVETPTKTRKSEKVPFVRAEIDALWSCVGDTNADIMLILCYTGMRVSELLTLRRDQIHGDHIITGSKTEAGRDRYIPIHPRIAPIISRHLSHGSEWAIVNSRGDKPIRYDSFHAKRWSKLKRKLKFRDELTIHSTRHFFVSELHRLGVDKIIVQKIVGHKGQDVTEQAYTHIATDAIHDAIRRIE